MTLLLLCGVMIFKCLVFIEFCWRMLLLCYLAREIGFANIAQRFWNVVPACLMWIVWKEWNKRTFEVMESSSYQLKILFAYVVAF